VAILRREAGRDPQDKDLRELIGELSTVSDEFCTRWAAQNVRIHRTGIEQFHHPAVGTLGLVHHSTALPTEGPETSTDGLHRRTRDGIGRRTETAGQLGVDRCAAGA
jgi:hypothetical protein